MTGGRLRWLTSGLLAGAGAGVLSLTSIMHSAYAFGDTPDPDIGLVMGGSGLPIPTEPYVLGANLGYISPDGWAPATGPTFDATYPGVLGTAGLVTPEGLYPLTGVNTLHFNDPSGPFTAFNVATGGTPFTIDGLPDQSTSVGQGLSILNYNILANLPAGDTSTVFGYSQSATISGLEMGILKAENVPQSLANFVLIGDPSAPNGGLLERFNGFETTSGQTTTDPLVLPSMGLNFDGATPADDYTTAMYSLEYDGFTDFPRYPLNFLADLNAFLGIESLHGTYLNQAIDTVYPPADLTGGPMEQDIANAILLPGSESLGADSLTNYYMIDTIDGQPITAPLVSLIDGISKPLGDLLGPDLTTLINLGYNNTGDVGWSATTDSPANVATPFGLFPDVNMTSLGNELVTGAEAGFKAFEADLTNGTPLFTESSAPTSTLSFADILSALETDFSSPEATSTTLTDIVNALSSVASTAYGTLLPTADILNALSTSLPAYDA
ncbi:MAG: PE-PPE domain-containing protein, partial [Mycobacterium sp.]|nr:PE-PPE domain-containing protein [Mycobacterium sp.]